MAPKYSTSFDLSLMIGKSDNEAYQIIAYSERLKKTCTASLLHSEVIEQLVPYAEQLQQGPQPLENLKDLGRRLFAALIRDQVRDMYRTLEGQNIDGLNLQLMLNLQPQILQRLPWECMFDPYRGEFLSLLDNTHIIRKVERKPEGNPREADLEYTNLVIAIANARGQPPIKPQREQEFIDKAIGDLHQSGKLNRRFISGSQKAILESLSQVPDVFHFVGHGGLDRNDVPGLYLEDENGDAIFVTAPELENEYFKPPPGTNRHIRLVILSACQTSETPKTEGNNSLAHQLASQVDAVLAMQFPVFVDNVTEFNMELYHALARGASLETAINAARRKIFSDKPRGARDWISPMLVTYQFASDSLFQLVSQNPFKGPIYYDTPDREQFIGRERELQKLEQLYKNQNIVVIRGESGCGKTSLLKAGLMAKLRSNQQPLVYISLNESLEAQLRLEINKLLTQDERTPLPEDDIEKLTGQFPRDLTILLDRVEQIDLLGEQVARIVTALISWANNAGQEQRRSRLIMATRMNERSEEPKLLQQQVSEPEYPRLSLDMLDFEQAIEWINAVTRRSAVIFLPKTIDDILIGLKYDHPEDRNMMALQVVCRAVYRCALESHRKEATPEMLTELNNIDGILEREIKIASKLNQAVYQGGEIARKVLAQFVGSDKQSMRPRSWNELLLRCGLEKEDLDKVLDQLQEDRLLRLVPQPGGDKYELEHETLVHQMDWLTDADIELRGLEEIIESAHTLIPLKSEKGGLEKLDARRDELTLTSEQQELLLRSALETGHETDYWFKRVKEPERALSALTSAYLSVEAQQRACQYLGVQGAMKAPYAKTAKTRLLELACASASPRVRLAASLALAPVMEAVDINNSFGGGREDLRDVEIEALATMFDSHWMPLKGLTATTRRQVRLKLLKINTLEIMSAAMRAACLGGLGFALAVVWIYAQAYLSPAVTSLPPLVILMLEFSLTGLLAFILALPGALCAPLGRDITSILSGGRRNLPAALGAISGSALGTGLTVVLLAALAEFRDPSLIRLLRYFISGAVLGGVIGLPWLLSARFSLKRTWLVLLVGLCGALAFLGVSTWSNWWPATSFALTLDSRYGWVTRVVPGILIGLGNAIGLVWGRLRNRSQ